jgi:hypothetical protein
MIPTVVSRSFVRLRDAHPALTLWRCKEDPGYYTRDGVPILWRDAGQGLAPASVLTPNTVCTIGEDWLSSWDHDHGPLARFPGEPVQRFADEEAHHGE